jgi:formate dehydrogenase subunit gamma
MMTDQMCQTVDAVLADKKNMPGALLPVLHGVQDALGFVPEQAVERIARELNLSRAEVHGVVTFYHHFRSHAAGQHTVQICRAEACQAMGSEALWQHACGQLGCDAHETTADGMFTLEPVYCLGLCASSPAIAVNDKVHARVSVDKFNRVLAQTRSAA